MTQYTPRFQGVTKDLSHINGLFRELIENYDKKLFVVSLDVDGTAEQQQRELRKRLRIANSYIRSLTVVPVNSNSRMIGESLWIDQIIEEVTPDATEGKEPKDG